MTRRGALIATMLLAAGELTRADQQSATTGLSWKPAPSRLSFDFPDTSFKILEIRLPGQTLTFTPEELAQELAHVHRALRHEGNSVFSIVGRRLDVCADCGQTFWPEE